MLRLLNEGKYDEVPEQLDRWVKAGSRTLAGLVARRKAEGELFAGGTVQPADDGAMTTKDVQRALRGTGWGDKGFAYASLDYAQDASTEAYGVEI